MTKAAIDHLPIQARKDSSLRAQEITMSDARDVAVTRLRQFESDREARMWLYGRLWEEQWKDVAYSEPS